MDKNFSEMNYYEMLDIPPDATAAQIRAAYNNALQMYQADSLVSYSFFSQGERREILSLLDKAYATLINEHEREKYNAELARNGKFDMTEKSAQVKKEPVNIFDISRQRDHFAARRTGNADLRRKIEQSQRIQEIISRSVLTGADLKDIRTELDVTIEKINQETKIRMDYLRFIEEDKTEHLPAPVFLKGFIKAYLKSLCLEPADELATRYMNSLPGKN
jgi:DnaJ-class molecular chaperone